MQAFSSFAILHAFQVYTVAEEPTDDKHAIECNVYTCQLSLSGTLYTILVFYCLYSVLTVLQLYGSLVLTLII